MEHRTSIETSRRPAAADAGIDLDPSRRPGVPRERRPEPWPHSKFPPARQRGLPTSFMHGRPNKKMPPVFGTAVPPRGVSGRLRAAAYRYPDHVARHWVMLLLADRVDSWEHRAGRLLRVALPALALGFAAKRLAEAR
jgi:hypothetical protein